MATKNVIAELLIEIGLDSKAAEKSAKAIARDLDKVKGKADGVAKETDKADKAFRRMGKGAGFAKKAARGLAAGMTAVSGVVAGLGKAVIGTGATFEKLRAQLKTATGSAQGAEKALAFIKDFAKNTPFQVSEITEAFVKLTNLGLEPSKRALTSYGDTASAMGKSLDQMIEAVADATTGEFERLKEFGIKARSEGDKVSFTFRGVTTTVGKNAEEIEEFLTGLGEQNFAGAMSDQMGTLNGIISNLKDAFTDFLLSVAEMGPLEEFKGLIADLRDASGDKEGLAKTLARTLVTAIKTLRRALKGDLVGTLKTAAEALNFVVENFDKLIFLFGAAKTFQAFNAIATGFRSMGVAAAGALGPIGLIASALIALIPIAIDAGNKIGSALAAGHAGTPTTNKRGGNKFLGDEFGAHGHRAGKISEEINREMSLQAKHDAEGTGQSFGAKESRRRMRDAQDRLGRLRTKAKADAAVEAKRAEETAAFDAAEQKEFGGFDADVEAVARDLGITDEVNTPQQQRQLEKAVLALSEGKSLEDAKKAAGLRKKRKGGGGRRKKKKEEKKTVTSPTTVSEFFGAAARDELGPIAARTPSTAEIEPTVAVDITNNNFSFSDTFNIEGKGDPVETGKQVILQIKAEFDRRLATAGQQMATNVVR